MRVLFATAEFAPDVKVGGLGDFSAGIVAELMRQDVDVEVLLPDYGLMEIEVAGETVLPVPDWAGPATLEQGTLDGVPFGLVSVPGIARDNPYVDQDGQAWPDNDARFFAFSAAVAARIHQSDPDVVHLNDWHTSVVPALASGLPPSVLTIHNLAYQGETNPAWLHALPLHSRAYRRHRKTNPLAGGIQLSDRVVMVSPTFAEEATRPGSGFGLDDLIRERTDHVLGILNGIDTHVWDPAADPHLEFGYGFETLERKGKNKELLLEDLGWDDDDGPLVGMVTRLTEQKGIDIALEAVPHLRALGARMVLLGSGERKLSTAAHAAAASHPDHLVFREGYDESFSHQVFAGSDLYLMPSRFEPAGLTQMQAMRYGSIPVATPVGGLNDTVIDSDRNPSAGNGFLAEDVKAESLKTALARAVDAWRDGTRRTGIIRNGMLRDWSWEGPARLYRELYQELTTAD